MALLEMNKITLIAHVSSKSALMKKLQGLGAVEVISIGMENLNTSGNPQALSVIESKLAEVRQALEIIRKNDPDKPSFFTPKPLISPEALKSMDSLTADGIILNIKGITEEIGSLKAKRQRILSRISQLDPYIDFDAPVERIQENRYTSFLLGSLPGENAGKFNSIRENYSDSAYFEIVKESKTNLSVFVVMLRSIAEKLLGELKYIGFIEAVTKDVRGVPADIVQSYRDEYDSLAAETAEHEQKLKGFVENLPLLKAFEDYLVNEIERERCVEKLAETGKAFVLEGWAVADDKERIEKALLETAPESYITFRAPEDGESPPTALRNKKVVQPFEMVTEMFSSPAYGGFDPNAIMSIFYFLLFGMMIGDAAYGALLTIGAWALLRIKKPTGTFRKVITIVMYCGISTIIWGLIFGTVFAIPSLSKYAIIDPIGQAITLLVLCLAVGVVHILAGLIVGAYVLIKRGEILSAVFDKMTWITILIGGVLIALGGILGSIGVYLLLAGLITVFLTAGRSRKGIFRKFVGGFSGMYAITGYFSDILSYCRLFGMGLSTSVIAMVFNTIASLFFGDVVGYILGSIVLIVGHVFNIGINALGAFVHTARLQFIEFYGKFYEGGGHTFAPLGIKARNYRLED